MLGLVAVVAACGARGGLLDEVAPAGDPEEPVPGADGDADAEPEPQPDPEPDPRVLHREICERVTAARDDGEWSDRCHQGYLDAFEGLGIRDAYIGSAVLRLDPVSLEVREIAIAGAAYGSYGRRDQALIDDAEAYLPMGEVPQIWSPDDGAHLVAVRRVQEPAGTIVVAPLLAASTDQGTVTNPTDWLDAAPLDQGCASTQTLLACGIDARSGTELPQEVTRAALESVLGTVAVDLITWGGYVFDSMVVRWAPTAGAMDDAAGDLFVVIAGGYLE